MSEMNETTNTTPSRKEIIDAAKAAKKAGADIKNPQFSKTENLIEQLEQLDAAVISAMPAEAQAVLRALGIDLPETETGAAAADNMEPAQDADQQDQNVTEGVAEDPVEDGEDNSEAAQDQGSTEEACQPDQEQQENPAQELPEDLKSRAAIEIAMLDMIEVMGISPVPDLKVNDELFMKTFMQAAKMATGQDNFSEYTWKVLEANEVAPERVLPKEIKKADLKETKDAAAAKAAKKANAPKKANGPCGLITKFLIEHDGQCVTRSQIHAYLVEQLPERNPDSMMSTIRLAVPTKWAKEKGFSFEKKGDGYIVSAPK